MKIHVVQKGDTLWELSKKYGVDFEELKQANTQLSSPDMIMPGMKIKIPGSSKPLKNTEIPKKQEFVHPYKEIPSQPKPVIKEDDHKELKKMEPHMPQMPQMPQMPAPAPAPMQQPPVTQMQMPIMEQEMNNYTTVNVPTPPQPKPMVKKEKMKKPPKQEFVPFPSQPMQPMCCYVMYPCCPPQMQWQQPIPFHMPMPQVMPGHFHGFGQSPMMEMPVKAANNSNENCGCMQDPGIMNHFHQRNQPESSQPEMNYYPPENWQYDQRNYPAPPEYQAFDGGNNESNE